MTLFGLNVAELTLALACFNSLAVPLILGARRWMRRVERRLDRVERMLALDPLPTHH